MPPLLQGLAQPLISNVLASLEHAEDALAPVFVQGALTVLAAGDARTALDEVTGMVPECTAEVRRLTGLNYSWSMLALCLDCVFSSTVARLTRSTVTL